MKWNYHPVSPGKFACISPVMGSSIRTKKETPVKVPNGTIVIQDSGAFSDGINERVSFDDALNRQINHSSKFNYHHMISHRASYDLLIDEKWIDGKRQKERWNEEDARFAVKETINSAKYLVNNRNEKDLILSAQGVTTAQYVKCCDEILPMMNSNDIFGMGGWCVLGIKKNKLRKSFREIICEIVPRVANSGINRIHIWGVLYAPALGELLWLCDKYKIKLSTDSSGPQKRPIFGSWGYADWKDYSYEQPNVKIRGRERANHVKVVRLWLKRFRTTKYYKSPYIDEKWRI